MRVIIMRHGEAMFEGPERVLTSRGREEVKMTTLKLLSSYNVTKIFCSPKKRALQTAQVVHSLLRGSNVPEVQILPELAPMGDASLVYDYINAVGTDNDTVLLISHIPQVLSLAEAFTAIDCDVPRFVTGGALILQQFDSAASYPRFAPESFFTPSSELIYPQSKVAAAIYHAATMQASLLRARTLPPLRLLGMRCQVPLWVPSWAPATAYVPLLMPKSGLVVDLDCMRKHLTT